MKAHKLLAATLPVFFTSLACPANAATVTIPNPIFTPGDPAVGGWLDGTLLRPEGGMGGEEPERAVDGVGQKFLNFLWGPDDTTTGIWITPSIGSSIATSMTLWTANDEEARDPASYELYGSNAILGTQILMFYFTPISSGPLALPSSRNMGGNSPLEDSNSQTVHFANTEAYTSYLVLFPTVKGGPRTDAMQIAEIQLNGIPEPGTATLAALGLLGVALRRRGP